MQVKTLLMSLLCLWLSSKVHAQFDVQAHYANGQVWVNWKNHPAVVPPETYVIYRSTSSFTSTSDPGVEMVGRLFEAEWRPFAMGKQFSLPLAAYRIPDGMGGTTLLDHRQGLFVATVQAVEHMVSYYYAVVPYSPTPSPVSVAQITPGAVTHIYDLMDPPICHLQLTHSLPGSYEARAYYMWADGRQTHMGGRPDFPVMANKAKNGMPSFFILSYKLPLKPAYNSMVHWLHGGAGTAIMSLPHKRQTVDLTLLEDQLLVAQNDDMFRFIYNPATGFDTLALEHSNSWWFGWAKQHDPFNKTWVKPPANSLVINYTQRRLKWINDWLIGEYTVDSTRVAIQGHSVGSVGTIAMAKTFPNTFSTATAFNCSFHRGGDAQIASVNLFGDSTVDNFATNLTDFSGAAVHMNTVFTLNDRISTHRDLPIINSFHGKNDDNGVMAWDPEVVAEYDEADEIGWGARLYWDGRGHGLAAGDSYWQEAASPNQTMRDDVSYQAKYRSNQSFPACHHLRPFRVLRSEDPGTGSFGTSTTSPLTATGDDQGTWAGYHDWDVNTIIDNPCKWEATIWLIDNSHNPKDESPHLILPTRVAVRKPQNFIHPPGRPLGWELRDQVTGALLMAGTTAPDLEGLVSVPHLPIPKAPDSVRLCIFCLGPKGGGRRPRREGAMSEFDEIKLFPNPASSYVIIQSSVTNPIQQVRILDVLGKTVIEKPIEQLPKTRIELGKLASGLYLVQIKTAQGVITRKLKK